VNSGASPAEGTHPLVITIFPNVRAKSARELPIDEHLATFHNPPRRRSKGACELFVGGRFGSKLTDKGSIRHADNLIEITTITGDYDGGVVSIEDARRRLEAKGVLATLYTSPSHTSEKPRWRVVARLSQPLPPDTYKPLTDRLDNALGNILADESWSLSQSYYFGRVDGREYRCVDSAGRCIDLVHDLDALIVEKDPVVVSGGNASPNLSTNPDATDDELREHIVNGHKGQIYPALLKLSARYIGRGMDRDDAIAALQGMLDSASWRAADPKTWKVRRRGVAKMVASAVKKYADPRTARGSPGGTGPINASDFYSVLPQHRYLFVPTRDLWPSESIDSLLSKAVRLNLDTTRAVVQMTWHPEEPFIIADRVVADGGWVPHQGVNVANLYREPIVIAGNAAEAQRWRVHLRFLYPDAADHIERWLAHRIQRPGQKINHALVLGGAQGIGKDTLLEPVKQGVGPWNWAEISPGQMLGRFNGWVKSVVVRVSEARDLGDVDRFAFYDHSKVYIAAPPDVIRVDEKNLREHPVFNVTGVIITTNHKTDGIYLPADDRRHFVAWSERTKDEFDENYWPGLWRWYESGGLGHVIAFLRELDLSAFEPKAPPPKTSAFYAIVAAGSAPEDAELRDVIEHLGKPAALTVEMITTSANDLGLADLASELGRKGQRALPHKMERVGFVPVRNPDADDGLFKSNGRRRAVYADRMLSPADQIRAARRMVASPPGRSQLGQFGQ
jgi:hypothetical protein